MVLGFPFETIYPEETRNELAKEILFFFDQLTNNIQHEETKILKNFTLHQNYPNPFNPTTTIQFSIPQRSYVTLKVFDLLGREVATLVEGEYPQGSYKVDWRAENNSTGIYFYKIMAGDFVETKKMVVMK